MDLPCLDDFQNDKRFPSACSIAKKKLWKSIRATKYDAYNKQGIKNDLEGANKIN